MTSPHRTPAPLSTPGSADLSRWEAKRRAEIARAAALVVWVGLAIVVLGIVIAVLPISAASPGIAGPSCGSPLAPALPDGYDASYGWYFDCADRLDHRTLFAIVTFWIGVALAAGSWIVRRHYSFRPSAEARAGTPPTASPTASPTVRPGSGRTTPLTTAPTTPPTTDARDAVADLRSSGVITAEEEALLRERLPDS